MIDTIISLLGFNHNSCYNDSGHISLWPPDHGSGFYVDWKIIGNSMM